MAKVKDPQVAKSKQMRAKRRRRKAFGLIFTCFALLGVASVIYLCVDFIHTRFFDDTAQKQDYQAMIAPLVALDPSEFSSLDEADEDLLLEAAIWAALTYEDTTKYSRNEQDELILPSVDVERYLSQMYGPDYKIQHHSFFDLDIEFVYDANLSAYIIPITSQGGSYTPLVEEITTSGNTRILKVAYMQGSTSAADVVLDPNAQTVVKTMEYILLKNGGNYYIYAVRPYVEQEEDAA